MVYGITKSIENKQKQQYTAKQKYKNIKLILKKTQHLSLEIKILNHKNTFSPWSYNPTKRSKKNSHG